MKNFLLGAFVSVFCFLGGFAAHHAVCHQAAPCLECPCLCGPGCQCCPACPGCCPAGPACPRPCCGR
jgi:hypothetical protein